MNERFAARPYKERQTKALEVREVADEFEIVLHALAKANSHI